MAPKGYTQLIILLLRQIYHRHLQRAFIVLKQINLQFASIRDLITASRLRVARSALF